MFQTVKYSVRMLRSTSHSLRGLLDGFWHYFLLTKGT